MSFKMFKSEFAQNCEDMNNQFTEESIMETPTARFTLDLYRALRNVGDIPIPREIVEEIISNAEIDLSQYDGEDPDFKRIISNWSEMVYKLYHASHTRFRDPGLLVRKSKLTLKF